MTHQTIEDLRKVHEILDQRVHELTVDAACDNAGVSREEDRVIFETIILQFLRWVVGIFMKD